MHEQFSLPDIQDEPINLKRQLPILKWAGGKRWLTPLLKPVWEKFRDRRLVEPFCGGLAISLGLLPKKALLNDINPHLINFYKWVQKGLESSISMENDEDFFYSYRERFNELIQNGNAESAETAQIFYYLNRTCYNGLCRFNQNGEFNVPFGRYKTITYSDGFLSYKDIFADWEFTKVSFEEVAVEESDFVYADPPYDVEFRNYSKERFSWEDQTRLVDWLSNHPGPVVISNQATPRIVELYGNAGFEMVFYGARRRISSNGERKRATEVLAYRFPNSILSPHKNSR